MQRSERSALFSACAVGFAFSTNYTNHAPMASALVATFGINLAAVGLLTTAIFLTHAGTQIPGGHLADRIGPKPVISWAAAIICIGNIAIGFATAYWQLLFCKALIGLGTGAGFVAGARYIAGMFAGPRLHLAQGLYGGSILLGSGFVIFAVPILFAAFGWQSAFFSTAALAAVAWTIWLAAPEPRPLKHTPAPFAGMLSNPQLWLLGLAQMASFGLVIVVGAWVTTYLSRSFALPLKTAGRIGSLVLLLGIATRPLGGAVVARYRARRTLQVGLALNVAGCLILGVGAGSPAQAAMGVLLLGIGCGLPYAAVFNRAAALYPARAGAAMGLVNMLGITMILAGPPLIGHMVDWSGAFQSSFLALGVFTLLAWIATFAIDQHESDRSV
jgi:nitrate/nitrite transporter NarK